MPVVAASRCGLNVDDRPKADWKASAEERRSTRLLEPAIDGTTSCRHQIERLQS